MERDVYAASRSEPKEAPASAPSAQAAITLKGAKARAPDAHPAQGDQSSPLVFTLDGDERLEAHLRTICAVTLDGLKRIVPLGRLQAIWLGGGYGRGEGGVLRTENGDRPYNDIEFYVCLAGNRFWNRRHFGPALHAFAKQMTALAEVDAEFHIITLAELRRPAPNMFYYDLVSGHRQLWGDPHLLADCGHHRNAGNLTLIEATRLLMNRGTGLLLASERLQHSFVSADDVDFIRRNIAKAQLALGDAVLTAFGEYHWSCRERHKRLLALAAARNPWFAELCEHHAAGVQFKLHPRREAVSVEELQREHRSVVSLMLPVWLWLESRRLGRGFASAREYVACPADKCPETNHWRNRLLNARLFGWHAFIGRGSGRHPRERIFNALAILLWDHKNSAGRLRQLLLGPGQTPDSSTGSVLQAYTRVWEQVR